VRTGNVLMLAMAQKSVPARNAPEVVVTVREAIGPVVTVLPKDEVRAVANVLTDTD